MTRRTRARGPRSTPLAALVAVAALTGLAGLAGCEAGEDPAARPGTPGSGTDGTGGAPTGAEGGPTTGGISEGDAPDTGAPEVVRVWYRRGEEPVAVPRAVGGTPLTTALHELVAGPSPEERERGLTSWFSDSTRRVLRRVRLEEGFLVVDFVDLPTLIPGASSSAGSQALLTSLDSTVFQFQAVDSVEYRLSGSCAAFWEWLQRECTMVRRP